MTAASNIDHRQENIQRSTTVGNKHLVVDRVV
jgi:hypothetical protein